MDPFIPSIRTKNFQFSVYMPIRKVQTEEGKYGIRSRHIVTLCRDRYGISYTFRADA